MPFTCTPAPRPTPRTDDLSKRLTDAGHDVPFALLFLARDLERENDEMRAWIESFKAAHSEPQHSGGEK